MNDIKTTSTLNSPARPAKKIEKVAEGQIQKKKKTGLKELTDGFIQEDVVTVRTYLWKDVLLPALKKTLLELITGGADMFLYGGSGAPKKQPMDKASWRTASERASRSSSIERVRTEYSFDDIIFTTRADAERVFEVLAEAIDLYQNVSVADLYSAAGTTGSYTDNNYGWTDISGARIVRFNDGYLLKMPKPICLNN